MATPAIFTPIAVDPVQLPLLAGILTIYIAGANGAVLDYILLINDTTTTVTATLHYVPNAGAVGDDNLICRAIDVPTDGVGINLLEIINARPFHMEGGGTIRGYASIAAQVTVHIGGTDYA
jgi:hypothetical protein